MNNTVALQNTILKQNSIETNFAYSLPKLYVLYKNENYRHSCTYSTMSTLFKYFSQLKSFISAYKKYSVHDFHKL